MTITEAKEIVELIIKGMPGESVEVHSGAQHGTISLRGYPLRHVVLHTEADSPLKPGVYPRADFAPTIFAGGSSFEGLTYRAV